MGVSLDRGLADPELVVLRPPEESGEPRRGTKPADELVTSLLRPVVAPSDPRFQAGDNVLPDDLVAALGLGIHTDTEAPPASAVADAD